MANHITSSIPREGGEVKFAYSIGKVCSGSISNVRASGDTSYFSSNIDTANKTIDVSANRMTDGAQKEIKFIATINDLDCEIVDVTQSYLCNCNDLTIGSAPSNWAWDSTVAKTVGFTADSVCITDMIATSSNNWFTASIVGNNVSVSPSGNNTTTTAKTATITVNYKSDGQTCSGKTFDVSQNAYGCSCDDLTIGSAPSAWEWDSTVAKTVGFTANSVCISDMSVSSNNNWFTASIVGSNISVVPSNNNTTTTAKTATITVSYKTNGVNCSKTFSVSQNAYVCTCDDLSIVSTPSAWVWDATVARTATYTINGVCITNISVSSNNAWFSVNNSLNGSNGTITISPSGNNTTTTAKTATITISYKTNGTDCSKTFTVEQNPYGCSCGDLSITSTPNDWAWNATASKTASYTLNTTCISDISVSSDNNWYSASNSVNGSNGTVTVTPSGRNTTLTAKTATITISYKSDGTSCSKTFSVSQNAYVCSCDDLTLGSAPANWAWNASAAKTVSYTANSTCISNVTVSSNNNWFSTSVNTSTNTITVSPSGNNITTTAKTATITVSYKTNGANCSKTFNVSQNAYTCVCESVLTITNGSLVPYTGYTASTQIGTYSVDTSCMPGTLSVSVASSASSWVTNASLSGGKVYAIVGRNESSSRSAIITISGTLTSGLTCSKELTLTQEAAPPCECGDLIVTQIF